MNATGLLRIARNGGSVEPFVLLVFATVYAGMILGELPRLALDRTGVALLGAIALLAGGAMTFAQAGAAVDVPPLALLFGLMVVSAQLRLGGFHARVAGALAAADVSPPALLALAGNLVLVGSIANLIVVDAASRHGIPVTWRRHARTGIPITLLTLLPLLLWGRS